MEDNERHEARGWDWDRLPRLRRWRRPPVAVPGGRVLVARSRDYQRIDLYSLTLSAAGIDHEVERRAGSWCLWVEAGDGDAARAQLVALVRENRAWPPVSLLEPVTHHTSPTVLLMGLLAIFHAVTGPWREGSIWFQRGEVAREAIIDQGQWWRLFTGLTLHADIVHLMGNVLIGGMLLHFLARSVGPGVGWSLACTAGVLGNLVNIWLRDNAHLSVGFSTAVFGGVGALATTLRGRRPGAGILIPLGGAVGLLAMLGAGGERTDLGAHLWGFVAGLLLGLVAARPGVHQRLAGRLGDLVVWFWVAVFAGAWFVALR